MPAKTNKRKRIILAICLLAGVLGLAFLLKTSLRKQRTVASAHAPYVNQHPQAKVIHKTARFSKIDTCKGAYRLAVAGNSLMFFKPDETIERDLETYALRHRYPMGDVYKAYRTGDSLNLVSADSHQLLQFVNGKSVGKKDFNFFWGNFIKNGDEYVLLDTLTFPYDARNVHYVIRKPRGQVIVDLDTLVAPYLSTIRKKVKTIYSGGCLFNYTKDTVVFLLSHLDKVALINTTTKAVRMVTTGAYFNYIPYKEFEVPIPMSEDTMITYESEVANTDVHRSMAINERRILIHPFFQYFKPSKEPFEMVDVYSKHKFQYLYSIPFAPTKKGEFVYDVACNDSHLYLLTSTGNVYKTAIPQ